MSARMALLAVVLGAGACAHSGRSPAAETAADPCRDPQYLALKAQPPDSLSEREYQLLRDREQACVTVQTAAAVKGGGEKKPGGSTAWTREKGYMIETHAEASSMPNTDVIRIRNNSRTPIVVTAIWLTDCEGIRTICGLKRMKEPVMPGQDKVVLTIMRDPNAISNYRYTFEYEPQEKKN